MYFIPVCANPPDLGYILGSCGLGSTSRTSYQPSGRTLQEIFLLENVFESSSSNNDFQPCPEGHICTEALSDGANICTSDIGSPLYTFKCSTTIPDCILGVASYYYSYPDPKNPDEACNGGSIFTRLTDNQEWIRSVIRNWAP